jgi:hypothetical protein
VNSNSAAVSAVDCHIPRGDPTEEEASDAQQ